jgi:hypothetical protein
MFVTLKISHHFSILAFGCDVRGSAANYSGLMPANFVALAHFSVSSNEK